MQLGGALSVGQHIRGWAQPNEVSQFLPMVPTGSPLRGHLTGGYCVGLAAAEKENLTFRLCTEIN